jgi:hypothetical protein
VVSLGFFFRGTIKFHMHGVDSVSYNKYHDTPGGKDGRCLRLANYHLQVPKSRNLEALTSQNTLGPIGRQWECFTFYLLSLQHVSTLLCNLQRAEIYYEGDTFCTHFHTFPCQLSSNQSPIKMAIRKTFNDVDVRKWKVNTKRNNKDRQVASCNFI